MKNVVCQKKSKNEGGPGNQGRDQSSELWSFPREDGGHYDRYRELILESFDQPGFENRAESQLVLSRSHPIPFSVEINEA